MSQLLLPVYLCFVLLDLTFKSKCCLSALLQLFVDVTSQLTPKIKEVRVLEGGFSSFSFSSCVSLSIAITLDCVLSFISAFILVDAFKIKSSSSTDLSKSSIAANNSF